MKITVKQLRGVIRRELNKNILEGYADPELKRIFSAGKLNPGDAEKLAEAIDDIKELVTSRELLTAASKLKSMSDSRTPGVVVAKFISTIFDEHTKNTIAAGLALASPEQVSDLMLEPSFGEVDVMSSELTTTLIEDPIDAIEKLKAMKSNQPVQDLWVVAYQFRKMHELLAAIARSIATPRVPSSQISKARKGFFANLFN